MAALCRSEKKGIVAKRDNGPEPRPCIEYQQNSVNAGYLGSDIAGSIVQQIAHFNSSSNMVRPSIDIVHGRFDLSQFPLPNLQEIDPPTNDTMRMPTARSTVPQSKSLTPSNTFPRLGDAFHISG
jgi:hypothetical protein